MTSVPMPLLAYLEATANLPIKTPGYLLKRFSRLEISFYILFFLEDPRSNRRILSFDTVKHAMISLGLSIRRKQYDFPIQNFV